MYLMMSSLLKARSGAASVDDAYVEVLLEEIRDSGFDRVALLAQDGVYDSSGMLDEARTQVYVPNDYLFAVTSRCPGLIVPCPSINPDRRDALEHLDRCIERGARLLKIHPPIQGVDLARKKHERFFARCAERAVVVLVHTGHEHSAPVADIGLADPRKLVRALDAGCTVVACHSGTGWAGDAPDFLHRFLDLARRYPRLYGDTSVLGTTTRIRDAGRLLAEIDVLPRLLHGSDYPFASVPVSFAGRIGPGPALRIQGVRNLLRRDLELKMALGFGRASAERSHQLVLGSTVGSSLPAAARRV
jgi:predicted TIM-barrel fold metal-dependent hydrolase